MRKILTLLMCAAIALVSAENVEITADHFEADQMKKVTEFIGNVHMKKGSDELNATKVYVYFDDKRKPVRYEAVGKSSFVIHMQNGRYYVGKADKLVYRPGSELYELYGNVVLKEPKLDRTIMGEKVVVEKVTGRANVEGDDGKPVRFIFKVEEPDAGTNR
ncbi:lipopolysaccharide transport periplasmic protein LptA [Hydrogenimonas sp.]